MCDGKYVLEALRTCMYVYLLELITLLNFPYPYEFNDIHNLHTVLCVRMCTYNIDSDMDFPLFL